MFQFRNTLDWVERNVTVWEDVHLVARAGEYKAGQVFETAELDGTVLTFYLKGNIPALRVKVGVLA